MIRNNTLFSVLAGSFMSAIAISAIFTTSVGAILGASPIDRMVDRRGDRKAVVSDDLSSTGSFLIESDQVKSGDLIRSEELGGSLPVASDLGEEIEPNGTSATATPLTGLRGRITGRILPNGDIDFYSFSAGAGDRLSAATMTSWSSSSNVDSIIDVVGPDGTTIIETDNDDGSFGATSSSIAGTVLASAGTYFIRVRNNSPTSQLRPYVLYFDLRSGSPVVETEPNGTFPGQPMPSGAYVSGATSSATDADFFTVSMNAGETIFISLDLDPERDLVEWNGQLGLGSFGSTPSVAVVNDPGSATPDSEAFFFTVREAGNYGISVGLPTGGTTFGTYRLSAMVVPAPPSTGCTTYVSTNVPQPLPTGPGIVSSVITVPSTTERIRDVNVYVDLTHNFMADIDAHIRTPSGNDNGIFTDIGSSTVGSQTGMNLWIDDAAAIPPSFTLMTGMRYKPESSYRLDWLTGEDPTGTWTLDIRDDATGDGGTLNNWSLEICTEPTSPGVILYQENFEPIPAQDGEKVSGDGGYTSSGVQNEWEYGVPNTPLASQIAAFTNCNGGSFGCWKTDLDNTYNASSNQDLFSPNIDLTSFNGTLQLEWAMRYQIESANFDFGWVEVQDVNNAANNRIVWRFDGPTMNNSVGSPVANIGASAGWGIYKATIDDFAGKLIRIRFHLESDTTVQLGGMAIDDVIVRGVSVVAANVEVRGRVLNAIGLPIPRTVVKMIGSDGVERVARTNAFGHYRFEGVEVGHTYILNATAKGHTFNPRIISVDADVFDADIISIE